MRATWAGTALIKIPGTPADYTDEQIADLATKGVIGSNDGVKADLTAAPAQA